MLKKIISHLQKQELIGWQIRETQRKSFQSFLTGTKRECARTVDTTSAIVTVFIRREVPVLMDKTHGNGHEPTYVKKKKTEVMGLSSFKVTPANIDQLEDLISEAMFSSELINNEPFELPSQAKKYPTVSIYDKSLGPKTISALEDELWRTLGKEKNVRLSSAEFFVDLLETRLLNHKGLDISQEESLLSTEFILLAKDKTQEKEFIDRYSRRFKKDFLLADEIHESAQIARDALTAQLPKTGEFPVLLSDEPLEHLFNPLVARASARLKYNKMMDIQIGQSVVAGEDFKGDSVTLWSDTTIQGGGGSAKFDSYGTPGGRICLISKNHLKQYLADKRYADYLNVPVTGELGNVEVEPGSVSFKKLMDPGAWGSNKIYQLTAFSAFEPNPITGAFSAEIRAGYEITPKGKTPIKGGSVSGIIQRDLLDCYLSKERVQRERYFGPKGILFKKLTIAGK